MKVPYLKIVNGCITKTGHSVLIIFNNEKEAENGFRELCSYLKDIRSYKATEEHVEMNPSSKKLYFTDTSSLVIVSTKRKHKDLMNRLIFKEVYEAYEDTTNQE